MTEPRSRHRVFTALAGTLTAAAVLVGALAFTAFRPSADVVLDPEPAVLAAVADQPPATSAAPTTAAPSSVAAADEEPDPAPTTTAPPRVPPAELTIDGLGISQGLLPVGLEPSGAMEVPGVEDIGWYLHGAVPGHPGATVLVAHVWWGDTPGPFHQLGGIEPGAPIEVRLDDGAVHDYTVVERALYDKDALPRDLWRNSGPETLVLITCGGEFDNATRRYEQNIVVYALPRAEIPE